MPPEEQKEAVELFVTKVTVFEDHVDVDAGSWNIEYLPQADEKNSPLPDNLAEGSPMKLGHIGGGEAPEGEFTNEWFDAFNKIN